MTRTEKIRKLANAIREYRGITKTPAGAIQVQWWIAPHPAAASRVQKWLSHLGLDITLSMKLINEFKVTTELEAWLNTLYE